jgi:hypothetical protein
MLGPLKKFFPSLVTEWRMPPDSCGRPLFILENALTGRAWTRPVPDIFLCTRNAQHIKTLEDREKMVGFTLSTMTCLGN